MDGNRREALRVVGAVALGGALGAVTRYLLSLAALGFLGAGFPWGTLAANVAGSFLIGLLAHFAERGAAFAAAPAARGFAQVGFCGGFTTLSAYSLETVMLWENGAGGMALAYGLVSPPLWITAVWLGWRLGARIAEDWPE